MSTCYSKFERLFDRIVVCAEFLIIRPWQITPTHTRLHIPQIHTCSNLGLVERNEYMWHCDCPKESDEVLFFSINTLNPSTCLEKASQCIPLESKGYSNIYHKIWTEGANAISKSQIVIMVIRKIYQKVMTKIIEKWFGFFKIRNLIHYWNHISEQ